MRFASRSMVNLNAARAMGAMIAAASMTSVTIAQNSGEITKLTAAEKAAGWQLLFDGQSTDRWRGFKQDGFPTKGWVIEDDGSLRVTAGGGGGDIITRDQYTDFELSLEFKVSPQANSGIMYGVTEAYAAPWMTGPEFQILDDLGHNLDATNIHSVGASHALYTPNEGKTVKPAGEFNEARIVVRNNLVTHYLNGMKVVEFDATSDDYKERIANSKFAAYDGFGTQKTGHLCLQDHGNDVWFRNMKVRDLSQPMPNEIALFNGENVDGWNWFSKAKIGINGVWNADDGILKCAGQPVGYIKTHDQYDNFVLKLEWRWDPETKKAGNSGVLVRQIGEDKVWPKCVEAQLMSGNAGDFYNIGEFTMTADSERTKGRRTQKLTAAENPVGEWNEYEIIVDHGKITLFVNGQFVNHAWDVEEIAGHICLQSEGAPIHFQNVRLAPID